MCSRSFAFFSRYWLRLVTTSIWCSTYTRIAASRVSNLGTPSTRASMFTGNDVCIGVCL